MIDVIMRCVMTLYKCLLGWCPGVLHSSGDTNQASIVSSSVIAVFWQTAPSSQSDAGIVLLCQNNDGTLQHFSHIMMFLRFYFRDPIVEKDFFKLLIKQLYEMFLINIIYYYPVGFLSREPGRC